MGPLFSGALLVIVTLIGLAIAFGIAKIFLPLRPAVVAAITFVGCGEIGGLAGLFLQPIWLPETLRGSEIATYLGISVAAGFISGALGVWFFVIRKRA